MSICLRERLANLAPIELGQTVSFVFLVFIERDHILSGGDSFRTQLC